jgi:hypothetical protein
MKKRPQTLLRTVGCFEHDNEPLSSINGGEFDFLNDCSLHNRDSVPWNNWILTDWLFNYTVSTTDDVQHQE